MHADASVRPVLDRHILLLSVALQLALALVFGHSFDTRVFMATGYLVGSGENPYAASDLGAVFHHVGFDKLGPAGYPPPWPLVLGLLYLVSYAVVPNLLLYNLALKLPVIAANVGLAYLVAALLKELGASPAVARRAWVLMLFNPVLLYFGAAWGQIRRHRRGARRLGADAVVGAADDGLRRSARPVGVPEADRPAGAAGRVAVPVAGKVAVARCGTPASSPRSRSWPSWRRSPRLTGTRRRSFTAGTATSP